MTASANWRNDAACRNADPELFFPVGAAGPASHQTLEGKRLRRSGPVQIPYQGFPGLTTSNLTPPPAAGNVAGAIASRTSGGFARDFATADGERVVIAALNQRQFADLAKATRLAGTFAFAERLLHADFSDRGDLYTHRDTIAALLAGWFARRTVADLAAVFGRTSVPWARLQSLTPDFCHDHGFSRTMGA